MSSQCGYDNFADNAVLMSNKAFVLDHAAPYFKVIRTDGKNVWMG